MSVCSKTNRFLGIILNSKFKPKLRSQSQPSSLFQSNNVDYSIIRTIHLSRNFYANISFNLTDIGEGIREVVVKEWFVKVGDKVAQFDNICEVQSDKASVTITSRYDGIITKLHYDIDATAYVGKPLIDVEVQGIENEETESIKETPDQQDSELEVTPTKDSVLEKPKPEVPESYKKYLCIPSVRRLAKEHDINLNNIKGTGKDGRILKEDVLKYLQQSKPATITRTNERTEPIRGFKKAMIKTMTEALKIPHFVYCDEISVTKLSGIRKLVKKDVEDAGIKLTMLPFLIKAISNSLNDYPILNATVDSGCENITYKDSHNIGVAMDTAVGLAVPVIKNVQQLSILDIARELNRLMKSGKEGNFKLEDLADGTFSISNIGAIGGTYASPVILPPQLAILAIGVSKVVPRFDSDNNVIPEEVMSISGSADHRVVDGATMAHFVNSVKKQIENPYLLFLRT